MTDREALAAALEEYRIFDEVEHRELSFQLITVVAAARERLAQLPEKCGTCDGRGWGWVSPKESDKEPCPTCHGSGKVYPAELVERIGKAATAFYVGAIQDLPTQIAVAVLDALNGETA